MIFYCSECFSKTEYKFNKPNFCQKCGAPASHSQKAVAMEKSAVIKHEKNIEQSKKISKYSNAREEYIDDDNFEVEYVPHIRPGAGVVVENDTSSKKITFGEAIQAGSSSKDDSFNFLKNEKVNYSKSEILEQFKKEASNSNKFNEIN